MAGAPRRCGGHVAVHGRDKYLNLLACGGVAVGSQQRPLVAPLHHQIEDASAAGTTPGNEIRERIMPVRLSERGALNRRYAAMSCSRFCLVSI